MLNRIAVDPRRGVVLLRRAGDHARPLDAPGVDRSRGDVHRLWPFLPGIETILFLAFGVGAIVRIWNIPTTVRSCGVALVVAIGLYALHLTPLGGMALAYAALGLMQFPLRMRARPVVRHVRLRLPDHARTRFIGRVDGCCRHRDGRHRAAALADVVDLDRAARDRPTRPPPAPRRGPTGSPMVVGRCCQRSELES